MRKLTIVMSLLLTLGSFCACSNNDDMSILINGKQRLFEDSAVVVPEYDYTGTLRYDSRYGWDIQYACPIDRLDHYFPLNLPDHIKQEGKVSFSGKAVKMTEEERESLQLRIPWAGETYYFIYLSKIEITDKKIEVPYRGNAPFAITDMPGVVKCTWDSLKWYISYNDAPNVEENVVLNFYYPKEISDEFKVDNMKVIISGNVYEEMTDPERNYYHKDYKIELTKIEKAE